MTTDCRNRLAWDELYGITPDLVWGDEPVPVLADLLRQLGCADNAAAQVLDAGAGEGRNVPLLQQALSGRLTCCDASVAALHKLYTRYIQPAVFACNLEQLPLRDHSFQLVLCWDVITTLTEPEKALQEFLRVLRPGGMLLCNISDLQEGLSEQHAPDAGEIDCLYQGRYFFRFLSSNTSVQLLSDNGFAVEYAATCSWHEKGHPNYRSGEHDHVSNVLLARKASGAGRKITRERLK